MTHEKEYNLNFHKNIYLYKSILIYQVSLYLIIWKEYKGWSKNKESYIGKFKGIKYPNKIYFIVFEEWILGSLFQFL